MFEAYTLLGALARADEPVAARHARHRRDLPQPGAAGEGGDRARRHLRRTGAPRHRRRLVRRGARGARLRVPAALGALRAPRGRAADLPGDVHRGAEHGEGHAPPDRRRVELAARRSRRADRRSSWAGPARRRRSGSRRSTRTSSTSTRRSSTCRASSTRSQGHLDRLGRDRSRHHARRASARSSSLRRTTRRPRSSSTMLQARGVADPSEIVNDPATLHAAIPRLFFGDPDEVVDAGAGPPRHRARRRRRQHAGRRQRSGIGAPRRRDAHPGVRFLTPTC